MAKEKAALPGGQAPPSRTALLGGNSCRLEGNNTLTGIWFPKFR